MLRDPNDEMREELLGQGYFAIGDYSDHGVICLAVKDENPDCRVVMVDYECGTPDVHDIMFSIRSFSYMTFFWRILFALFLLCPALLARAQQHYTDSLYEVVNSARTAPKERLMALSELADVVRFYNEQEALQLAQKAVALAGKEDDRYKVYAYQARSAVHLRLHDEKQSLSDMDSSLQYAERTTDAKARAWAYYQKGRELAYNEKNKEALAWLLKALRLIKGKGYLSEEAGIYYALYGVFSTWEDLDNEDKYALLALDAAQRSKDPNRICEAWQAVATATEYRYLKTPQKALLDSALQSLRHSIATYRQNEGYMKMIQLITIPCINMANAYNQHFPASAQTTDSLRYYAMLAFNYASKDKDTRLQAAAFGLMNEDAKRNGNFELAETYLVQALSLLKSKANPDQYILSNVQRDLSELAARRKDYAKALEYHKAYLETYKKIYDAEQTKAGKDLEAKYEAKEKEQQIQFLKKSEALNRKLKYLYIGIAAALFLSLLFLFRSYHFRLRYSLQKEKLLEQENEEARLLAKIKAEEAQLLENQKQKVELHARLQEQQAKLKAEEAARLEAEQKIILLQNETLQKEVLAGSLHVEQKNRVLQDLKIRLEETPDRNLGAAELKKLLNQQYHLDRDFEEFITDLKEVHPDFYKKVQERSGNKLTALDLKYCAYIFLKRSTKEIAASLGVAPKSVRMSKYRLKQKLGLDKDANLDEYIQLND